jgi:hypothetical protein
MEDYMRIISEESISSVKTYFTDVVNRKLEDAIKKDWATLFPFSNLIVGIPIDEAKKIIDEMLSPALECILFEMVSLYKVLYQSVDPTENETATLSGLIIIPKKNLANGNMGFGGTQPSMPILGYQHGTLLYRGYAPSQFYKYQPYNFIEVLVAILFASLNGYIVAMADYQGMGDDNSHIQPYMCASPLSQAVADLLLETKKYIDQLEGVYWNEQIFLTGYSQGGYVTMATAKKIQEDPKKKYSLLKKHLIATAPCAGPYSLSKVMHFLMLRDEEMPEGRYFLPMVIRGFYEKYGSEYADGMFTKEKALKPEYYHIWELVDGSQKSKDVEKEIPAVPKEILSDGMITALCDPNSDVYEALLDNDLINWKPDLEKPEKFMQLYHSNSDDMVPFENSVRAYESFKKAGLSIPLVPMFYIPLGVPSHVGGAIPCLLAAYAWVNTFRNKHSDKLRPGDFLLPDTNLYSENEKYCLHFEKKTWLVLYRMKDIKPLWDIQSYSQRIEETGGPQDAGICINQIDNAIFAIYDCYGDLYWSTDQNGSESNVTITDEGTVVCKEIESGRIIWTIPKNYE